MVDLNINVPQNFYEQENRNGFIVTTERKKLWAVELDLLMQIDRVCKKYNLRYCVGAGTLLGAVRHKGFIPWDNDLDIYMLRRDYDKLMKLKSEFDEPYFLQTPYNDKIFCPHMKLRRSDTTGYTEFEEKFDINRGIFIDIFPLDGVSGNALKDSKQKKMDFVYKSIMDKYNDFASVDTQETKDKFLNILYSVFFKVMDKRIICNLYERNLKKYSNRGSRIWGNRTLVYDCPKSRRPIEDWKSFKRIKFEFIKVPIPVNYHEILEQQYGNYMKMPKSLNGSRHGKVIISTQESYKAYKGNGVVL